MQLVFRAYVDDELVGQAVDRGGIAANGCRLAQGVEVFAISLGFAGVGAIMLDRLDTVHLAFEQGKVVVLHVSLR
ncbi:hypothetical protein D3C76_1772080 [compost metagenome]